MQNNQNKNNQPVINSPEEKTANGLTLSEITKVVSEQMAGSGNVDGMSMMKLVKLLGSAIMAKKAV